MIIESSEMQRSALLVAIRVDVGATVLDQNSSTLEVPVVSGMMQSSPPIGVHVIQICFALNDGMQGFLLRPLLKFR